MGERRRPCCSTAEQTTDQEHRRHHRRGTGERGQWAEYTLPAEHYVFYVEGPEASAILRTVSYSARASLAHPTAALPVPATWKHVTADGLRFAVPASWPVKHMSAQIADECGAPLWDLLLSVSLVEHR